MFPNIGVDLLHLPRLTSLLFRRQKPYLHRFARRILTNAELATFQQQRLAAANEKEAAVRWLGVRFVLTIPPHTQKRKSFYIPVGEKLTRI
jgi:phosphopantetheinyl transferase (holo-ACP synthase)